MDTKNLLSRLVSYNELDAHITGTQKLLILHILYLMTLRDIQIFHMV